MRGGRLPSNHSKEAIAAFREAYLGESGRRGFSRQTLPGKANELGGQVGCAGGVILVSDGDRPSRLSEGLVQNRSSVYP